MQTTHARRRRIALGLGLVAALGLLATALVLTGTAPRDGHAQQQGPIGRISLNAPVSFPVDI